jgi:nucleoside 2-deoxyribosyltransferase
MSSINKIYLAGPISGQSYYDATYWRNQIKLGLNSKDLTFFDPMDGLECFEDYDKIPTDCGELNQKEIFERDLNYVRSCDLLIANLAFKNTRFIGTFFEVGVAFQLEIPIIFIVDRASEKHPFVQESAYTKFYFTLSVIDYLKTIISTPL